MIEMLLEAERALSAGSLEAAERMYWRAIEMDGRNVIAIVGLARVAHARGDARTASTYARQALDLDPENAAAPRLLADNVGPETPVVRPAVAGQAPTAVPDIGRPRSGHRGRGRTLVRRLLGRP